ncbi:MAG: ORF6N domain-containing protein [Gallionellaceae bacterium]
MRWWTGKSFTKANAAQAAQLKAFERFPEDFMFQLTTDEFENLKSQFAISSSELFLKRSASS